MRHTTRAMLGMLLAVVTWNHGVAEEAKSPWWRIGGSDPAPQTPAATTAPTAPTQPPSTAAAVEQPRFAWPSIPKLSWPPMTIPDESPVAPGQERPKRSRFGKPAYGQSRPTRNSWAQPPAGTTPTATSSSPWQAMKDGAHRVSDNTRNAWKKTVDFVTPGDPADPQVVQRQPRESWWSRMWGSEEEVAEGPQTVTEWMAQDRLDP